MQASHDHRTINPQMCGPQIRRALGKNGFPRETYNKDRHPKPLGEMVTYCSFALIMWHWAAVPRVDLGLARIVRGKD